LQGYVSAGCVRESPRGATFSGTLRPAGQVAANLDQTIADGQLPATTVGSMLVSP
jgi:hypothetical protein